MTTTLIDQRLHRAALRLITLDVAVVAALAALVWQNTAASTDSLDRSVARALYAHPGTLVRSLFAAITFGGQPAVVGGLAVVVAVWAWRRLHHAVLTAFAPLAVAAASVIERVLKTAVGRSRPATALLAHVSGKSFPSGHATGAAAIATSVAFLVVAAQLPRRRIAIAGVAVYAAAISASRLVLGVHYLTDVIAGTAIGVGATLAVAIAITKSRRATS